MFVKNGLMLLRRLQEEIRGIQATALQRLLCEAAHGAFLPVVHHMGVRHIGRAWAGLSCERRSACARKVVCTDGVLDPAKQVQTASSVAGRPSWRLPHAHPSKPGVLFTGTTAATRSPLAASSIL